MSITDIAAELGMDVRQSGNSPPSIFGCPACGASTRHSKARDRRGAVGIRGANNGWRCFQCDASGDGVDLVAFELCDSKYKDLRDDQKAVVRAKLAALTGLGKGGAAVRAAKPRKPIAAVAAPIRSYLPLEQASAFWSSCRPVVDARYTHAYLLSRGLDPTKVSDADIARALPLAGYDGVEIPGWAVFGRSCWRKLGYHLIVPLRDANGVICSFIARNVHGAQRPRFGDDPIPKSIPPKGFARGGLVAACPLALQLLTTGATPSWWSRGAQLRVVITEGEVDYLAWATACSDADAHAHATFGIVSGSWTADHASRVPDGCTVVIATDCDPEGDRYATKIADTFARRTVDIERWEAGAS